MGKLRDLFAGGKPQTAEMVHLASRSYIFQSMADAERFVKRMKSPDAGPSAQMLGPDDIGWYGAYNLMNNAADDYGGVLVRSITGRETRVYGYAQHIFAQDREYLEHRDPTAAMFITTCWETMWNGLPLSYIAEIDAYFAQQAGFGIITALQAAYSEYYQEGGGLIYLEATGNPDERIRRGDRPLAWTFVPARHVLDNDEGEFGYIMTEPGNTDPLLDHGIEYISIYRSARDKSRDMPTKVHGSRIIPVNLDPKSRWWRTHRVPLHRIYDTLWELRDLIFSRVRAHFQGDPIVVDVDLSADAQKALNFAEMTQAQKDAMGKMVEKSIVDYGTGAKSSFAPVMGFKMRRLGAAQLPDPKEDVMMLSSRLAHGSVYPIKFVLASTKGNSDVSDQDLLILQGNLQNLRNTWGYKHLSKALLMGQVMGVSSLRMQGDHNLPPAKELEWPLVRPLSPRDAAFTEKTDIVIYREAQEAGLTPPLRLQRKFERDPRYPIPLWLAARGRDVNGKNTDVAPLIEPGAAGDAPAPGAPAKPRNVTGADLQEIQDHLQAIEERLEDEPRTVAMRKETSTE